MEDDAIIGDIFNFDLDLNKSIPDEVPLSTKQHSPPSNEEHLSKEEGINDDDFGGDVKHLILETRKSPPQQTRLFANVTPAIPPELDEDHVVDMDMDTEEEELDSESDHTWVPFNERSQNLIAEKKDTPYDIIPRSKDHLGKDNSSQKEKSKYDLKKKEEDDSIRKSFSFTDNTTLQRSKIDSIRKSDANSKTTTRIIDVRTPDKDIRSRSKEPTPDYDTHRIRPKDIIMDYEKDRNRSKVTDTDPDRNRSKSKTLGDETRNHEPDRTRSKERDHEPDRSKGYYDDNRTRKTRKAEMDTYIPPVDHHRNPDRNRYSSKYPENDRTDLRHRESSRTIQMDDIDPSSNRVNRDSLPETPRTLNNLKRPASRDYQSNNPKSLVPADKVKSYLASLPPLAKTQKPNRSTEEPNTQTVKSILRNTENNHQFEVTKTVRTSLKFYDLDAEGNEKRTSQEFDARTRKVFGKKRVVLDEDNEIDIDESDDEIKKVEVELKKVEAIQKYRKRKQKKELQRKSLLAMLKKKDSNIKNLLQQIKSQKQQKKVPR